MGNNDFFFAALAKIIDSGEHAQSDIAERSGIARQTINAYFKQRKVPGIKNQELIAAACGLAVLVREVCEHIEIWSFSKRLVPVPLRRGFALRDAIVNSQGHGGTYLGLAIGKLPSDYDRLIIITDEQSHDKVPDPKGTGYVINVASNQNGVGYGPWTHIDGWSEAVIDYIRDIEDVTTAVKTSSHQTEI